MQEQIEKGFVDLVEQEHARILDITKETAYAQIEASPDHDIFENIRAECRPPLFWLNFKSAAPSILNEAMGTDPELKEIRDKSIFEELAKSKIAISQLHRDLQTAKPEDVDIVKATRVLRMLEERIEILKHLKNPSTNPTNPNEFVFPIKGTPRTMKVDREKLRSVISVQSEGEASEEEKKAQQF